MRASFARASVTQALFTLVAVGHIAAPSPAAAQACCTVTGAGEFGVVGPCHVAGISAQLSYQRAVGSYDEDGDFHRLRDASVDDVVLTLAGGVRFADQRLQLTAAVPTRLQHRRFGEESTTSVGFGDVTAGFRALAVEGSSAGFDSDDRSTYVPFVELFTTVRAPTGRAPEDTRNSLGADIMGDGSWGLTLGTKVSAFLTLHHSVALNVAWSHRFARDVPPVEEAGQGRRFAPGEALDLRLAWTRIVNLWWSYGAFGAFRFTGAVDEDGQEVANSETHRTSFGFFVTHAIALPEWETTLSVSIDPFWPGGGSGLAFVGPTAAISIHRYFH